MRKHLRFIPVLALAALLAGCQGPCEKLSPITVAAPRLNGGSADFSRYVAVGTSISAGWQSGGLVDRHQVNAITAIFARQVGKTVQIDGRGTFTEPTVNGDGIPPLLQLRSVTPPVITNDGEAQGNPTNTTLPTPYDNMAVPGALLFDFANTARYATGVFPLVTRYPTITASIRDQALSLAPTFLSFEFGANEVLGPATSGFGTGAQLPMMTPAAYAAELTTAMDTLHLLLPNTKVALLNVPDVTSIPFCTTLKPYTILNATGQPTALLGPNGPLAPTDLVLLTAEDSLVAGTGFPVGAYNYLGGAPGNGRPLADAQVLDTSEQASLETAISAMNAAVDSVSLRPWIAEVDLHGLLSAMAANGLTLGATHYTTAFVTGGLFSLDGVHPTDLADAIIANTMIDAVNLRFGANVPHANPMSYATATSSAAGRAPIGAAGARVPRVEGIRTGLRMLAGR